MTGSIWHSHKILLQKRLWPRTEIFVPHCCEWKQHSIDPVFTSCKYLDIWRVSWIEFLSIMAMARLLLSIISFSVNACLRFRIFSGTEATCFSSIQATVVLYRPLQQSVYLPIEMQNSWNCWFLSLIVSKAFSKGGGICAHGSTLC